jgi:hypothetical protein
MNGKPSKKRLSILLIVLLVVFIAAMYSFTKVEPSSIQQKDTGPNTYTFYTLTVIYVIVNPLYFWSITIAISCIILLGAFHILKYIELNKTFKMMSVPILIFVSFILGFNSTIYLVKNARSEFVENCVRVTYDLMSLPEYSPKGCGANINSWTPIKEEKLEVREVFENKN